MTVTLKSKDAQTIRRFIPLTTLSESAFNKLCSQIQIEEASKGTVLFKQGDRKKEFVYLLEGAISLQAAGMEMDIISGGSEEARFALAHQIPRKVFAVAKDRIRFIRVNAEVLNSNRSISRDSVSYEVSDIPNEASGDWMTALLKSPIFQRLPAANLQKVLTSVEKIEVKAGQLIVKQGDAGDYYYIIKEGRCSLTRKPSKNAREIKLAELKSTETFGEDSLISGTQRNVNVTMLTDGVLLRLGKENFLELIKNPVIQSVSIDQALTEVEKGAVLLDVRSPDDFEQDHIKGSRNAPFFSLRLQIASFGPAKKLVIVCEDGTISQAASFLLIRFGFDAIVLKGGINAIPARYRESFTGEPQALQAENSADTPNETTEPVSTALPEDQIPAPKQARQIISQLQKQLQAERNALKQEIKMREQRLAEASSKQKQLRKQIADLTALNKDLEERAKADRNTLLNKIANLEQSLETSSKGLREARKSG